MQHLASFAACLAASASLLALSCKDQVFDFACVLQGPLAELFDSQQLLYDVSGAGNNWAHGHHGYGPQYRDALLGRIRSAAEAADSLQGFLLLHSLGGGTGSGLGTYLLGLLEVRCFGC
jgi:hypothetical protein